MTTIKEVTSFGKLDAKILKANLLKFAGVKVKRCRKDSNNCVSVYVNKCDIEKTLNFFNQFDIVRNYYGVAYEPFEVNSGEFNGLMYIKE